MSAELVIWEVPQRLKSGCAHQLARLRCHQPVRRRPPAARRIPGDSGVSHEPDFPDKPAAARQRLQFAPGQLGVAARSRLGSSSRTTGTQSRSATAARTRCCRGQTRARGFVRPLWRPEPSATFAASASRALCSRASVASSRPRSWLLPARGPGVRAGPPT